MSENAPLIVSISGIRGITGQSLTTKSSPSLPPRSPAFYQNGLP